MEPAVSCMKTRLTMSELTFSLLRCHFQTGRSFVVSGEGRNRVLGYRRGVQCDIGDVEQSEWTQMVRDVINREGEQKLFQQLLQHLKDHNYAKETKAELEFHALQLHASRIFDNEAWVDFLDFNRRYRPEVAASARLVWIRSECCKKPGEITQTMLDSHKHIDNRVCCPHCGRWAHYEIMTTLEMEERTNECE